MTVEMNRDLVAITRKLGEIKYLSAKIKQSPTDGSGRFVAVVSTFGPPPDTQNDIVTPGAFRASIAEASVKHPGSLWPVFWMHMYDDPENVIGVVVAAAETSEGLVIEGQLDLDNERAMNVYEGLLGNRIREWSIAYAINKAREDTWKGEHVRYLDELELLEISAVYSGANRFTRTVEVRSRPNATSGSSATVTWTAEPQSELDRINARLDALASGEKLRNPAIADQVEELVLDVREELVRESLDRAEQAAWERRMHINMVLDPVPVRVDARMRPVTS
jgi:HK97 family phage prohead protease